MLSRRSLFSLFVGAGAVAAGAKVTAAPAPLSMADLPEYDPGISLQNLEIMTPEPMYRFPYHINCRCVIVEHEPVNVRADGSIRHRQHHPVDFPPKRN